MCVVEWNGCWWHGCDDASCGNGPRSSVRNGEYWLPKIRGNRERDARKVAALEAAGWKVLSFWGHDDPVRAADLIVEVVTARRVALRASGGRRSATRLIRTALWVADCRRSGPVRWQPCMTGRPSDKRLTAVDLFAGAGGLSEGLRQAGFEVVVAADHDPDACATHELNFPEAEVVVGDLTDRERHERVVAVVRAHGRPDLVAGGPPCQAFSQIHNHDRLIADPRNRLYQEFVALVDELRPRAFVMENVPGMAQLRGGAVQAQVEEDLSLGGDYDSRRRGARRRGLRRAADPHAADLHRRGGRDRRQVALPQGTGLMAGLSRGPRLVDAEGGPVAWLADPADARAVTAAQALSDLVVPGAAYTTARGVGLPAGGPRGQRRAAGPRSVAHSRGHPPPTGGDPAGRQRVRLA